jgi:hypothetical protein
MIFPMQFLFSFMRNPKDAEEASAQDMRDVETCINLVIEKIRGQLGTTIYREEVCRINSINFARSINKTYNFFSIGDSFH